MTTHPVSLLRKEEREELVLPRGKDGPMTASRSFHVMAKPSGPICNLDCEYCFFLSKEALYPGDRFRMRDGLVDAYIRQLLESHPGPEVTVAWQGGEPTLMGVDFFRRAFAVTERQRRPDQTLHHTIQTNGTLLTDEWCELFAVHDVLVGISIDGPPEVHDVYRVDKRGNATSAKVLGGLAVSTGSTSTCSARSMRRTRSTGGTCTATPRRPGRVLHPVHPHRGTRQRDRVPRGRPRHRPVG
jgi:sulfatase maturation enzyme AslB (radical SAM superfamily)